MTTLPPNPTEKMRIDLAGKIREKKLAFSNTLLPLFEAIVNSIQAIEDGSATKPGIINITVGRIPQTNLEFEEASLIGKAPVMDFTIRDNGIGFTEENFESFNFAHSTYKLQRGGKGVGRIIWLRAFDKVEIESVYPVGKVLEHRRFNFLPTREGVENHRHQQGTEKSERFTEVRLKGLKKEYQKWCNSDIEDIAFKIIEHCFMYFLRKDCPVITIIDGDSRVVVNDLFRIYTKEKVKSKTIQIKVQSFNVKLVRLFSRKPDNKIHYCADTREVQSERISLEIPELDTLYTDENGERYSIAAYVTGDYLNQNANEERTEINFSRSNELGLQEEVSIEEIRVPICNWIRREFGVLIESLSEDRMNNIRRFVTEHPRYRQVLKYKPAEVMRIRSTTSDDNLEIELFKLEQQLNLEVKMEADAILKDIYDGVRTQADFKERAEHYQKIIDVGNSKLSEYIIYRKVVLDILDKKLKPDEKGKFQKEESIHSLIFPLRRESDDIGYDEHNLWVIDERLAFHKYLASDKLFKQNKLLESGSTERPDLLIFNRPCGF